MDAKMDLLERLRWTAWSSAFNGLPNTESSIRDAIKEIERLRALLGQDKEKAR